MKTLLSPLLLAGVLAGFGFPAKAHLGPSAGPTLPGSHWVEKAMLAGIPAYYRKKGTELVHSGVGKCTIQKYDPATCDAFSNASAALKNGGKLCTHCNSLDW